MIYLKNLKSVVRYESLILVMFAFAIPLHVASAQDTQGQQTISPKVYHKFGEIFKIEKYKFVTIPADPRVKNPQAKVRLSVMSINGVELKEPLMMSYRFSHSIVQHMDQFDKLANDEAPIFAYESLRAEGRPFEPPAVLKEMENWTQLPSRGFCLVNTLEIVDAKGLDLGSYRKKLERLSQEIRDDAKRASGNVPPTE